MSTSEPLPNYFKRTEKNHCTFSYVSYAIYILQCEIAFYLSFPIRFEDLKEKRELEHKYFNIPAASTKEPSTC